MVIEVCHPKIERACNASPAFIEEMGKNAFIEEVGKNVWQQSCPLLGGHLVRQATSASSLSALLPKLSGKHQHLAPGIYVIVSHLSGWGQVLLALSDRELLSSESLSFLTKGRL